MLNHFSCVRLCATPQMAAHQNPCPWDSSGKNAGVGCHFLLHCMKVKSESEVTQSCSTLCDPMGCSPPGSSIYGIFQARVPEWVAIAFSMIQSSCCKKKKNNGGLPKVVVGGSEKQSALRYFDGRTDIGLVKLYRAKQKNWIQKFICMLTEVISG